MKAQIHFNLPVLTAVLLSLITSIARGRESDSVRNPTGHLKLNLSDRSPLSDPKVMEERGRPDPRRFPGPPNQFETRNWEYDLPRYQFDAFIPPDYRPDHPHGLLVWTGVVDFSPEWFDVLARHKLIFITPIQSERNYVPAGLWVDAVHNMKQRYNIDAGRIYSSGFSDGARYAKDMLVCYPDLFTGVLCLCGDDFYETFEHEVILEGAHWRGPVEDLKKRVRIAMMRGENDRFTPAEGRIQYEALILDGFQHVSFFVVPGMGHQLPDATWYERGIRALDDPPTLKPPTTAPTKNPRPTPGQIAIAKRQLASAKMWHVAGWPGDPGPRQTRLYLQRILDEYPTTPSAKMARDALKMLDTSTTRPAKHSN